MVKANSRHKALYSLLLISTLGILLNIQPTLAFSFNGHELRDLQACDKEDFWEEAREWTASKLWNKKVMISECDGELLLGGYSVLGDDKSSSGEYFQRTYKNLDLPKHTMIYFTASFSLIDHWDADEDGIKIFINDEKLERLQFSSKDFPSNKCGGPGKDLTDVYVVGKVPHDEKYLTIKIVSDSKKPCDTASFGFRDISILFVTPDRKEHRSEVCAIASVPLSKDQCICPKGSFLSETKGSLTSWAGKKCVPGDRHCAHSFGPSASDCYECAKGTFFDGECCVDCHHKCEECTGAGPDKCTKQKHKLCHKGLHFWKESETDDKCVRECPEGWKCDQDKHGNDICVPKCDLKDEDNTWFAEINKCVCECPQGWRTETMNKVPVCIKVCRKDEFWWEEGCEGGACVEKCPEGWECAEDKKTGLDYCQPKCCDEEKDTWFEEKGECVCECPDGWEKEKMNDVHVCSHACKDCQFWWEEGSKHGACVDKCPEGWRCDKGCEGVDICSPQCHRKDEKNIWFDEKKECVCECPDGWETEKVNDVLVCVKSCDKGEFWWKGDGKHGACVCECPEGWRCDKGCGGVDICSPQCDAKDDENIWFQEKKECVCECPKGWRTEKVNDVLVCVHACECDQFWWEECGPDGACVCECPEGWKCDKGVAGVDICTPQCNPKHDDNIWFQEKKECVCECSLGWRKEKVNDVLVCVQVCEKDQFFWEEGGKDGACVCECPEGWKCDKGCEGVDICTPICKHNHKHDENIWFQEKKECVCECPRGWRSEKVNDVLVCVHVCDKGQFWWEEGSKGGACVCECPEGWRCDKGCEGVDICSPICNQKDKENIWFAEKKECVCECPEGWEREKVNDVDVCVPACDKGQFFWEEGGKHGACVSKCPEGWRCDKGCEGIDICSPQCSYKHDENIWFQEKGECVCECPEGWEKEKVNDVLTCQHACKEGQFWWGEGGKHGACVDKCPEGWRCDKGCEGVDICTPICNPKHDDNIWFQEKKECVCECPSGWRKEKVNDVLVCVKSCDKGQFWWEECGKDGACVCECPEGWKCDKGCEGVDICTPQCNPKDDENIWFQEKKQCVCECPRGWRTEKVNDVPVCVQACECDQFWWDECGKDGACVEKCPEGWKCGKGPYGIEVCVPQCDRKDNENIWFQEKKECVCECPDGWEKEIVNDVFVCSHACGKGQYWWNDSGKGSSCVEKCPEGWRCDKGCEGVDICVPKCDAKKHENIWFQEKGECVCECPKGWEKEKINDVAACVKACDDCQFWWEAGAKHGACVEKCPEGWRCDKGCEGVDICSPQCAVRDKENIWFQEKGECVCECPSGWEKEKVNDVDVCVHACEKGQFFWEEGGKHGACVEKCPDGWVCGKGCEGVDICEPICRGKEDIWFQEKKECVCECPSGWRKEKVNDVLVCVESCDKGEFWWEECGKDGACVCECPEGWRGDKGCEGVNICVPKCDAKKHENIWFQEKKECVCECPDGWRTEKLNDVLVCIHVCDEGEFWWEKGGKDGACVCECPDGWTCGKGAAGVDVCKPQCDRKDDENIWFREDKKCVCECPKGWEKEKVNAVHVCRKACHHGQFFWAEGGHHGVCVEECPNGWECAQDKHGLNICKPKCDERSKEKIWFQEKGQCVHKCPNDFDVEIVNKVPACVPCHN